jgi:hypothetical protein
MTQTILKFATEREAWVEATRILVNTGKMTVIDRQGSKLIVRSIDANVGKFRLDAERKIIGERGDERMATD